MRDGAGSAGVRRSCVESRRGPAVEYGADGAGGVHDEYALVGVQTGSAIVPSAAERPTDRGPFTFGSFNFRFVRRNRGWIQAQAGRRLFFVASCLSNSLNSPVNVARV